MRSKTVAASYFQKILCIQGVKTLEHYPCSYFFQKIFVSMPNHLLSKVLNSKYFHVYIQYSKLFKVRFKKENLNTKDVNLRIFQPAK